MSKYGQVVEDYKKTKKDKNYHNKLNQNISQADAETAPVRLLQTETEKARIDRAIRDDWDILLHVYPKHINPTDHELKRLGLSIKEHLDENVPINVDVLVDYVGDVDSYAIRLKGLMKRPGGDYFIQNELLTLIDTAIRRA